MISEAQYEQVQAFIEELGVPLHADNRGLYLQAMTHSSYSYEYKTSSLDNYERLEFLGDAVLKLVVSHYVFERFPQYREGEMTKIRSVIVSDAMLAEFALELGMDQCIIMGPAESRNKGRKKVSNLACAFEALLGALYMDGHQDIATGLINGLVESRVEAIDQNKTKDNFKAVLQELTQAEGYGLPEYETVKEAGPAHRRLFQVEVLVNGEVLGWGEGSNKKEAQQSAAKMALEHLDALDAPPLLAAEEASE